MESYLLKKDDSLILLFGGYTHNFTDPRSFTPFQPVHRSLCFHKWKCTAVDWSVSNRESNTPDIQLDSWWISLVQPLKATGTAGLHFGLLWQEPTTHCSNYSPPKNGVVLLGSVKLWVYPPNKILGGTQCAKRITLRTGGLLSNHNRQLTSSTLTGLSVKLRLPEEVTKLTE